jgi:hypothetical protein
MVEFGQGGKAQPSFFPPCDNLVFVLSRHLPYLSQLLPSQPRCKITALVTLPVPPSLKVPLLRESTRATNLSKSLKSLDKREKEEKVVSETSLKSYSLPTNPLPRWETFQPKEVSSILPTTKTPRTVPKLSLLTTTAECPLRSS